jgi:hypothetical protein
MGALSLDITRYHRLVILALLHRLDGYGDSSTDVTRWRIWVAHPGMIGA